MKEKYYWLTRQFDASALNSLQYNCTQYLLRISYYWPEDYHIGTKYLA